MVNGAGLAMATMDIIKLLRRHARPISSMSAAARRAERVTVAFKLILSDPNVEAILVNIFGGIMRCDVIAEGIVAAAREVNLHVPLVVRLEGTNVELGRKILSQSGLPLIAADNLEDAARKVVAATARRRRDGDPRQRRDQGDLPGLHRLAGHLPFRAGDRLRHQDGRRRDPGKRRHHGISTCRCSTPCTRRARDRRDRERDLRAAALRRRRDPRSGRRRHRADRLHHRGHPGARHGAGQARPRRHRTAG